MVSRNHKFQSRHGYSRSVAKRSLSRRIEEEVGVDGAGAATAWPREVPESEHEEPDRVVLEIGPRVPPSIVLEPELAEPDLAKAPQGDRPARGGLWSRLRRWLGLSGTAGRA